MVEIKCSKFIAKRITRRFQIDIFITSQIVFLCWSMKFKFSRMRCVIGVTKKSCVVLVSSPKKEVSFARSTAGSPSRMRCVWMGCRSMSDWLTIDLQNDGCNFRMSPGTLPKKSEQQWNVLPSPLPPPPPHTHSFGSHYAHIIIFLCCLLKSKVIMKI